MAASDDGSAITGAFFSSISETVLFKRQSSFIQ
jgi:hypothetical protein